MGCSEVSTSGEEQKESSFEELFENDGALDIDATLEESQDQNKPILLYFTGFNVGSFRKWEEKIFKNPAVISRLSGDFIFKPVFVDDKRLLPKNVETESCQEFNRPLKTVGDANLCLQIKLCNSATQPYLLALDSRKRTIGEGTYETIRNLQDFSIFWKK